MQINVFVSSTSYIDPNEVFCVAQLFQYPVSLIRSVEYGNC